MVNVNYWILISWKKIYSFLNKLHYFFIGHTLPVRDGERNDLFFVIVVDAFRW